MNLIGPYSNSIRQNQLSGTIIQNNASLTYMKMIGPAMGWFEIAKLLTYDIDKVTGGNDDYIDKASARVIQLFNNTCLNIYQRPRKVMFDKVSEFKQYSTHFLKCFILNLS